MRIKAGLNVALSCASEHPFLTSELCKCLGFLDFDKHHCPCLKCEKGKKSVRKEDDCAVFRRVITPHLTVFSSYQSDFLP